ncbi:glutathione S-transferase [Chitinivorax tropicus]|uniref:Glutathione S-transferase n=1 Tax=Chitinivorax tropicus TaxID=714531 RepID=A0A840MIJ2_9PROT|nr:glutathione S-transferase family protein [Chitinivorax tropicus]MBB5017335.1 glutathione S-transferase [Chitinivorax tropicus]
MGITLYAGSGSPFVWRVWLALEYKQLPYALKMLSFSEGDTKKPEFKALNPRGKVPTLTDGEFVLWESTAILNYLDDAYGGPKLFPGDAKQRARIRRLQAEVDNYFGYAVDAVWDELIWKESGADQAKVDEGLGQMKAELAYFETQMSREFLAGELSAADFTLYSILAYVLRVESKRLPQLGMAATLGPKLKAWMARIEALPFFDKTYPPHWRES